MHAQWCEQAQNLDITTEAAFQLLAAVAVNGNGADLYECAAS
jgi:hypothetical protein